MGFIYFVLIIASVFLGVIISMTIWLLILRLVINVSFVRSLLRNIINKALYD